jgi:hypothetical protein
VIDLLVPTCQRDLPQLALLLRSLDTFLDRSVVSSLHLASIDRPEAFNELRRVATHKFQPCTHYLSPGDLGLHEAGGNHGRGWLQQQVAKLSFARHARGEFFMVLDSKNVALRPIGPTDLIERGRAQWALESISSHRKWWRGSAWALAHERFDYAPGRVALSSAAPVIFHTSSVVAMIDWLEQHHGESLERFFNKWRPIRHRFMRATEFTLYYVYMDRERLADRHHLMSNHLHDSESQIWTSFTSAVREERLRRILGGHTTGLFTGIHFAAWKGLTEAERAGLEALAAGTRHGVG